MLGACAASGRDGPQDRGDGKAAQRQTTRMSVQPSAVVHISILTPPKSLVVFLSDMEKWKTWAQWIHSVARTSERDWSLETEAGRMKIHFVESNSLGVLDHEVTLESGTTVFNSMRVLPNGTGSELVMVVFQS